MVSSELIDQAIQALYEQDHQVLEPLVKFSAPHHSTIYASAAEELEKMARTGSVRGYWGWMTIFHGILSLPERQNYVEILLETLKEIIAHDGSIPYVVGRAFEETLLPEDIWAVEPILAQVEKSQAASAGYSFSDSTTPIVVRVLGLLDDRRSIHSLHQLLSNSKESLAGSAALALAEQGEKDSIPDLLAILSHHPDPDIVTALGMLHAQEAVPILLASLDDYRESRVRNTTGTGELVRATVQALGQIGDPSAIEPIGQLLETTRRGISLEAALALSYLGDDRGMALISRRKGTLQAARRLVELNHPEGVSALIHCYQSAPSRVPDEKRDVSGRQMLLRELGRHGSQADDPLLKWVEQHDFEQTDSGWTLAEEAQRSAGRISARKKKSSGV